MAGDLPLELHPPTGIGGRQCPERKGLGAAGTGGAGQGLGRQARGPGIRVAAFGQGHGGGRSGPRLEHTRPEGPEGVGRLVQRR